MKNRDGSQVAYVATVLDTRAASADWMMRNSRSAAELGAVCRGSLLALEIREPSIARPRSRSSAPVVPTGFARWRFANGPSSGLDEELGTRRSHWLRALEIRERTIERSR
jgi:hypothetical protein